MKHWSISTTFYWFVCLFLILQTQKTHAQSLLKDGSTWHYEYRRFWTAMIDYNKCVLEGDTIIQQKKCFKFKRRYGSCDIRGLMEYIYEEEGKYFYFEKSKDRFVMLYDFTKGVGDTIAIEYWPDFSLNRDSIFHIRIDSMDWIQMDTFSLKRFYVTYDRWDDHEINFEQLVQKGVIVEGIGSLTNFFYFFETGLCDGTYNTQLRCFTYPGLMPHQFENTACEFVTNTQQFLANKSISIYPNPIVGKCSIHSDIEIANPEIILYNVMGQKVFHHYSEGIQALHEELDLSFLPNAIYIIAVSGELGNGTKELLTLQKLVKQ